MPKRLTTEQIKKIVADQLRMEVQHVTDESGFVADLGADSLDCIELVMRFEDETGCDINDDDAEKLTTVGELIAFVNKLTA